MAETLKSDEVVKLQSRAIFGFDGKVKFGLKLHPDKAHSIIPLGTKVIITDTKTNRQEFLIGHTNKVSCVDISFSGKYVVSGQLNFMGFRAYVIVWDYESRKEIGRHDLHKVCCESVRFTAEDKYVISIGGVDDGSVIVFDMETHAPICQAVAVNSTCGYPNNICPFQNYHSFFMVAGDRHLRLWKVEKESRKLIVQDVQVGRHQRKYTSMIVNKTDTDFFIGTMTGDVAHVKVNFEKGNMTAFLVGLYGRQNARKPIGKDCEKYKSGIRVIRCTKGGRAGRLLIGAGNGDIEQVDLRDEDFKNYPNPTWPKFTTVKSTKVNGAVTSIARITDNLFLIGTDKSEIYELTLSSFHVRLKTTCHTESVNEVAFPHNISSVFASAGYESIRVWSMKRMQELLRIMVYNFHCKAVVFSHDGTSIVSAWNDGVIRAFTPISGKLIYAIPNAHNKGCSALALSKNDKILVSAGIEGQVRVWKIEPFRQSLVAVLKDHTGPISSLHFNTFNTEVVSAGTDGSCVLWDINRMTRKQEICANTQFTCARFHPTGVQLLTAGSDGRIGYWMVYNGSLLRELQGSAKESVNCVSFNPTGDYFAAVGHDTTVKIWDYLNGTAVSIGLEHASEVICCNFSPCGKYCVSGSITGAIIIWDVPKKFWPDPSKKEEISAAATFKPKGVEAKVDSNAPSSNRGKNKENIDGLESSRTNKEGLRTECPPVDHNQKPDISETCKKLLGTDK